ncbi:NAD(P)-dependent oxidoreductase [Longispora fulva]|uniref:NAD(P)H dehydrogenase (Quinone) n=1 Tax=Longispora fulva TaxID=619741 RepID=A0A8J7GSN8_9ACTN|nr:NAD(P)H-binding protein [Longispora fulva]MBG6137563.1 NAD(P)H dehydrogenase (quinone) [Longispora fulva]GIG61083.1 NAD(P)-dependent oxidoreductase [Longispora fulva]
MLLVTGANGQLGRRVVTHLLARVPATALAVSVRDPGAAADLAALGVSVRRGDFDEPDTLPEAFAGARRMLLISSAGMPHEVRFAHHRAAVAGAVAAGVSSLVYTSLSTASPASIGEVHRRTEAVIAGSGLRHTFLRNPLYTDNFLGGVLEETELVTATGRGRVASALRDDLAEAAAVVLADETHDRDVYDLTGPAAWSQDELAAALSEVTGRPVTHDAVAPDEYARQLRAAEVPEGLVAVLLDIHATIASGGFSEVTGDLAALLGRRPLSVAEAVRAL